VVPQRDPAFYDSYLRTFTLPVLGTRPLPVGERALIRALSAAKREPLRLPAGTEPRHAGSNDHIQPVR
jgi:hypothetical protein